MSRQGLPPPRMLVGDCSGNRKELAQWHEHGANEAVGSKTVNSSVPNVAGASAARPHSVPIVAARTASSAAREPPGAAGERAPRQPPMARHAPARGRARQVPDRADPEDKQGSAGVRRQAPRRASTATRSCKRSSLRGSRHAKGDSGGSMPARRGRAPRDDGLADARDPGVPPTSGHGRRISTVRLRRERTVWREKRPASPVAGHSLSERREANASRRARRQRLGPWLEARPSGRVIDRDRVHYDGAVARLFPTPARRRT
jgi:hypothetical protein